MTAMTHPPVAPAVSAATPSRWPLAGIGAGICGLAMIVTSMNFGVSDDERILADPERFAVVMQDQRQYLVPFVVATTVGALLLVVFAAGLRRHLAAQEPVGSNLPDIAAGGLWLVSAMLLVGGGISTELYWGLRDLTLADPTDLMSMYHLIATMAWLWAGAGLAAVVMARAALKHGSVARWLGWVSAVLGGLTLLFSVIPLQYMSGFTGTLWLLIAGVGTTVAGRRN